MPIKEDSRYRWYVLVLAMLTYGSIAGAARLCMPVLFPQIAEDLNLSLVAIGTVWGMDPLAGVFIGLPGGLFADRFGIKRTLTVVCILAGIFGALRGFSVNFLSMSAFMFLFGLMAAMTPSVVPKVTVVWFTGKRLALANGMLNVAWSIGAVIATLSSATLLAPWLGSWRNVLFFFGAPPLLLGLLWWLTGREPSKPIRELGEPVMAAVPFRQALSQVLRIRDVWVLGLVLLCYWGANMGFGGYLPMYLRNIGWTPAAADAGMTLLSGIGILGVMPMVIYSNKIGSRKIVIAIAAFVLAVSMAMVPLVSGNGVWAFLVIGGLLRAGAPALANTMLFEMKGVGGRYAGTAIGLTNTLGMLGAFAAPPLGNSLATISDGAPMFLWAGMSALVLPLLLFLKERKMQPEPAG
ncbi:MAG: MFS transporter [Dehalococcoidales bacterium]|nr:MFS transporter [Dehalococcoidales bacterium]